MTSTRYAAKHGPNLSNTINAIINRTSFNAGNLWSVQSHGYMDMGQMSHDWRELAYARANYVSYVVYSYRTPIAWYDNGIGEWILPDYKYSTTTSAHQSVVRRALSPAYVSDVTAYAAAIGRAA